MKNKKEERSKKRDGKMKIKEHNALTTINENKKIERVKNRDEEMKIIKLKPLTIVNEK